MTDRELLELIAKRLDNIEDDIIDMKSEMSDMKSEMSDMKSEMEKLKSAQRRTEATLENTVDKCVQVLYESHTLNAERFDKFDIESIKRSSDLAVSIAKVAYEMATKKAV